MKNWICNSEGELVVNFFRSNVTQDEICIMYDYNKVDKRVFIATCSDHAERLLITKFDVVFGEPDISVFAESPSHWYITGNIKAIPWHREFTFVKSA